MTVTRWCQSGRLPAISKPYGKKLTYWISPQAVEMLAQQEMEKAEKKQDVRVNTKPHSEYLPNWKAAMAAGLINGKAFSPRTIEIYSLYADDFIKRYQNISPETLQSALMKIAPIHFAKRLKVYESIVCFGKFLVRQGIMQEQSIQHMKVLRPKRHIPPKRFTVDDIGLLKLIKACNDPEDRLIVTLLSNTGLRAFEACSLRLQDIDLEKGILIVQCGKGGKRRQVGLTATVTEAIQAYLSEKSHKPSQFLLLNSQGKQMDRHGLYHRLEKIGKKAGVTVSPHALRRAFVTINANKGRPLQMLQMACGHSDIQTTRSYCLTKEHEVIEAMKAWD
jgi:integrase/recombinase XerD